MGGSIIPSTFAFVVASLLIALFFSMHMRAHVGAQRARCLSNLKLVGLAMKQYALDNDEVFPWDESEQNRYYRFLGKLHPDYADELELFQCPYSRDRPMRLVNRGDPGSLFKESECKSGLSYAYGHKQGKPWTEEAPSSTRIAADKYATQDYLEERRPAHKPTNHPHRRFFGKPGDRFVVRADGSARSDDDLRMLEANPDAEFNESGDPKHDQTGPDWWSDPPDK